MKNILKKIIFIGLLFLLFEVVAFFSYYPFAPNKWVLILLFISFNLFLFIICETGFRYYYRKKTGYAYSFIQKIPIHRMYVEPHPYLPYVYKTNFQSQKPEAARYPLNKDKGYYFHQLTSNNYRHNDGPNGNRDMVVPKPLNQFRVLCLGASTTGNYIGHHGNIYSYPMELEKILKQKYPDKDIIIHNCGQGGWTSAEILINFLLNLYDTNPDAIILYHAYNDLPVSLTSPFKSDYSHARRNLGESIHLYKLASLIPFIPSALYNFMVNAIFPYTNPRHGVLGSIRKNSPDINNEFRGLQTYRRNIAYLIKICKTSNIEIILSSFAHYPYEEASKDDVHKKYAKGLELENDVIRALSKEYNTKFVDNYHLIPKEEKYFVDTIHFTPEGMKLLAENFSKEICPIIENRYSRNIEQAKT